MNFEWKLEMGKKLTFDDKINNMACFEIVLNILRMKSAEGLDVEEELTALCGFAIKTLFDDRDLADDSHVKDIIRLKEIRVDKFKSSIVNEAGMPNTNEVGEA